MDLPRKFGRFTLLEKLTTGGMAEVYRGVARGPDGFKRILAIKKILPDLAKDHSFRRMFIDEASIAARLNHANIAQVYEFDIIGDTPYIAMEFVEGKDLRAILERLSELDQAVPYPIAVFVALEVAKGLYYVHTRRESSRPLNIVHRDVSPQNIMLSHDGGVKLVDFGIARASKRTSETQVGMIKGKFAYMSPEQALGRAMDHRSDIFSLGVVLWEMLTAQRLFRGHNDAETVTRLLKTRVPAPHSIQPGVPEKLAPIVLKALNREKEQRYPTMLAFYEDLTEFLVKTGSYPDIDRVARFLHDLFPEDIERMWQGENLDVGDEVPVLPPESDSSEDLDAVLGEELPDPTRPPKRREAPFTKGGGKPPREQEEPTEPTRAMPLNQERKTTADERDKTERILGTPPTETQTGPIATGTASKKDRTKTIVGWIVLVSLIGAGITFGWLLFDRFRKDETPRRQQITAEKLEKKQRDPEPTVPKMEYSEASAPESSVPTDRADVGESGVDVTEEPPAVSPETPVVEGLALDEETDDGEDYPVEEEEPPLASADVSTQPDTLGEEDKLRPVSEPVGQIVLQRKLPPEVVRKEASNEEPAEDTPTSVLTPHKKLLERATKEDKAEEPELLTMRFTVEPKDAVLRVGSRRVPAGLISFKEQKNGETVPVQARRKGYKPVDRTITLENKAVIEIKMHKKAEVELRVDPPRARVEVDGKLLRRSGARQGLFAFIDAAGKEVEIRIEKKRYETEVHRVLLYEGLNKLHYELERDRTRTSEKKKKEEVAKEGYGYIYAQNRPYARVYLNGESKGDTPVNIRVKAGTHTLEFRRIDYSETIKVEVKPGKTTKVIRPIKKKDK